MPRRWKLSPEIRKDPARAKRFIDKYEKDLLGLFSRYFDDAVSALEKEYDIRLTNLAIDGLAAEAMVEVLKKLALSYGPEILDIAKRNSDDAYKQGVRVGSINLERAGVKTPSTLVPADWRALDWIEKRNLTVLEGITQDINDAIVREVSQGLIQGESVFEVGKRLAKVSQLPEDRAYRIARFETMLSLNQGTINRYYQRGIEKVEWIAGYDEHTCDECLALDGKIFDIDDIPDCPLHVNCRCTLAPVVIKDYTPEFTMKAVRNARQTFEASLYARISDPPHYLHTGWCNCPGNQSMEVS